MHLAIYLAVNAMLWILWAAVAGTHEFPWPIWVTLGWGIGVAVQWLSTRRRPISAEAVAHEVEHLRQR